MDRLDHIFLDIERVLGNRFISDEARIDYASAIFRSNEQCMSDARILYHVVGDIVHELLKNHISEFRTYIPLVLRIYHGFTGSTDAHYMGLIPGRESEFKESVIKPTLVLKACIKDDNFSFAAGELYEMDRFVSFCNIGQSNDSNSLVIEAVRHMCSEIEDLTHNMVIPLHLSVAGEQKREPYGFITLINTKRRYTESDINIAHKITSYFTSHLRNFDILRKDQLTQFYNQQQKEDLFASEIRKGIQNNYCIGLMILDVDNFKQFNDRHGHLNGDSLLAQLGSLILDNIRPYDRPVRIGGEEFVIIAPKVDCDSLPGFAERLRELIHSHTFKDRFSEQAFENISASFGVLLLDNIQEKVANTEYYFDLADKNLYEAKRKGKNRIEYSRC
jgi:diguanylate cyclase (GGDEF)-like protein